MHDPMTVAFEIRYPWRKYGRRGRSEFERQYRESFITIWHVDPETDGSDDSCGFTYPKPAEGSKVVKGLLGDLEFLRHSERGLYALEQQRRTEGSFAWWMLWMQRASWHDRKRGLSWRELSHLAFSDSFPGNRASGVSVTAETDLKRLAWIFARAYGHYARPWWRHPRWHVWHWKVQIHPVQRFKRWAFSRCAHCGGRFTWGYAPVSGSWSGTGPRWFRGEGRVWHSECDRVANPSPDKAPAP